MLTNTKGLNEIHKLVVHGSGSSASNHRLTNSLRVREALADLYRLLEDYSPSWYTEEYREKVRAALQYRD